jgi:hypothetical protein
MPPKTRGAVRKPRRKDKKNIALGQAHIKSTFNNTIVSSRTPAEQSSPGPPPVRSGSRAHASPPRSLRSWLPKPPRSVLRSTASARSTSSSRARDPDAKPQSVAAGHRPGGRLHLGRHPQRPQRLPSPEAPPRLIGFSATAPPCSSPGCRRAVRCRYPKLLSRLISYPFPPFVLRHIADASRKEM